MSKLKIAIASGKGGTGKTLVSTNLFWSIHKELPSVALVDCDAEEPNDLLFFDAKLEKTEQITQKIPTIDPAKCTYCGLCKEYCNYNAIFFLQTPPVIKVLEDLCHGCGACSVACKHQAITEKDRVIGNVSSYCYTKNSRIVEARMRVGVQSSVLLIKAAVKTADTSEIVLMDAPPGTSCPFIQTVASADYVVLVTEPTPFGLSDLQQSVETLKTMNKPCGVVVNRSGLGDGKVYEYLQQENIPLLMSIPFDKLIALNYSNGEIVANFSRQWKEKFILLYQRILKEYGNSRNKW